MSNFIRFYVFNIIEICLLLFFGCLVLFLFPTLFPLPPSRSLASTDAHVHTWAGADLSSAKAADEAHRQELHVGVAVRLLVITAAITVTITIALAITNAIAVTAPIAESEDGRDPWETPRGKSKCAVAEGSRTQRGKTKEDDEEQTQRGPLRAQQIDWLIVRQAGGFVERGGGAGAP